MTKKLNKQELLANNPKANAKQLEEGLEVVRQLRDQGFSGSGYNLVRPFTKKLVRARTDNVKPQRKRGR